MIQIKNVTITHKEDARVILEDFSCVWNDGDKAVIIGEEGNGKSTLLQWIASPDRIGDYCEASGERIPGSCRPGTPAYRFTNFLWRSPCFWSRRRKT